MAFRHVLMGSKVATDPAGAAAELSERMRAHGANMGEVATALGVHRDTLADWFDRLEAAGHPVTGRGAAKRGRKLGRKAAAAPGGRVRRAQLAE